MARIFRNLRLKLMANNKITRYLVYAAGEILLVVIGILIALQLNNLNAEKKNRQIEQIYLSSFHNDLAKNIVELERVIEKSAITGHSADSLIDVLMGTRQISDSTMLFRLLFNPLGYTVYKSAEGTIQDIIGSNQLIVIQNDSIRIAMASWTSDLKNIREYEKLDQQGRQRYEDVLTGFVDMYKGKSGGVVVSDEAYSAMQQDRAFLNSLTKRISSPYRLNQLYRAELKRVQRLSAITRDEMEK